MTDKNIEIWKMKKLISKLQSVRGNGTSMISIIIKPGDQIFRINKMLTDEAGTASNIKSRVNRLSVLSAITSAQQRLKLRNKIPTNGLVVYCGTIMMDDEKEKKFSIDFEPFRPVNTSLYMCDNKFHTKALSSLLEDDMKFGFIIMDGNGVLFANLSGNTKVTLAKFSVDLPKKHGRGGQSALRFARLRVEKRNNYVRKVAETACQLFITNDKVNVEGIILAGSADFKTDLHGSNLFDMRLLAKVIKKVDISYGGNQGLHQAIQLSMDCISNLKFVQEQKLISKFFEEINQNTGRSCYGIDDIVNGLKMGVIETIIAWENLPLIRYSLINNESGETCEKILRPEQSKIASNFIDKASKVKLEIVDEQLYLDYLAEKYNEYGAGLETVSDKSPEGSQFVKGFGGIGGLLRYKVDFVEIAELDYDSQDDFYMDAYDI